ncbi:cytosolic endo-beta-N-acetylglucosaminidase isoform X1 [Ptiloglossa arizonensis]|uniref:cytosolic endo-beta-N-acetylglucosaminidase isoform X1 n=2 Tax=Ptiloglossa arizonensis TaxID=3350558 RepID=UPI003FA109B4
MEAQVAESQPFKNLKELYDNVDNLKLWPDIKELRESTDYVYRVSEINTSKLQLEKVDRFKYPKTLLCHDMKGGYLEDRFIDGSKSYNSYLFYHWSVIDTFVYFSHYFITIPPFGWINAAHNHGVKVLGTLITEREGIWEPILETPETVRKFADALILVAKFYKFEGWLLNVENNIESKLLNNLIYFIKYLTEHIHTEIRNSEIIWYDSIIDKGQLKWQNEVNDKNIEFFLNCDGIFLNYNWTESKLANSYTLVKNHNQNVHNIYVGLDVWGRGCPGGGGFNSTYALEKIREQGLSVAIFGSAWTYEFFGPRTFRELETVFWAQLFPSLYIHVPIYEDETFQTSFCSGYGRSLYHSGEIQLTMHDIQGRSIFERKSFYNLAMQKPQISMPMPHLKFVRILELKNEGNVKEGSKSPVIYVYETKKHVIRVFKNIVNIEDKLPILDINFFEFYDEFSYDGGGCLKLITNDPTVYHRLFLIYIECKQEMQASIIFNGVEPILILGNDTGLKSIMSYKSVSLDSRWKKCFYSTNIKTVNEIGVSFTRRNICYLGEIILEEKQQHSSDSSEEGSVLSQLDDKLINKRIDDGNSNLTNSQNVTNSTTDMKEEKTN